MLRHTVISHGSWPFRPPSISGGPNGNCARHSFIRSFINNIRQSLKIIDRHSVSVFQSDSDEKQRSKHYTELLKTKVRSAFSVLRSSFNSMKDKNKNRNSEVGKAKSSFYICLLKSNIQRDGFAAN